MADYLATYKLSCALVEDNSCAYYVTTICRAYYDNAIDFKFVESNINIERMLTYT